MRRFISFAFFSLYFVFVLFRFLCIVRISAIHAMLLIMQFLVYDMNNFAFAIE